MSVTFNLQDYQLTCYSQSEKIALRLEPLKVENKVAVQYLYQAEYRDPSLPEGIKFLFNQSTTDWYRYIEFHREKCFELNLSMIKKDEDSDPNGKIQYTELPFIFKMKVMEGIKESKFKLYGEKELFSKELKLQKLLNAKENAILDLKKTIDEKNIVIEELKAKLNKVNQQKEELRQENQRLFQQELPRKKLHYSQQPEQGCLSHETNGFRFSPNQDSNSSNKSQKSLLMSPQTQQIVNQNNYSTQNQPSLSYPNLSESHQNEPNQRKVNEVLLRQPGQLTEKHSETFYNRPNKLEIQQHGVSSYSNTNETKLMNNLTSVSMSFQNKKSIEDQRKHEEPVQNTFQHNNNFAQINQTLTQPQSQNQTQTQNLTRENEKQSTQMNLSQQSCPQIISAGGQLLSEESLRMIREFASKKCLMDVGYDERNQKKYGYCCIFCEKIFKEDEFLSKHLFSRHPQISNETTSDYLTNILTNFKKRREQKIAAFEANHAAERRFANRAQILQGRT